MKTGIKASELVKILEQKIKQYGDLKIIVNTQDGGSYNLYGEDDVSVTDSYAADGTCYQSLEIGG